MAEEHIDPRHENVWKAQDEEHLKMTKNELCVRARELEEKGVRAYWVFAGLLAILVPVLIFYVFRFSDPLVRIGNGLALATFLYLAARLRQHGFNRRARSREQAVSCVTFLRSELHDKRTWLLNTRRIVCLLMPASIATWWGGGPVAIATWIGIDNPRLARYQESPAPLLVLAVLLAVVWVGSGREARQLQREIEQLETE